ncbi:MAG: hypothetical protein JST92_00630 [Deltaproteobacteria bacterium]|nr:hypothetical protein [Deltaproteobacteria bacterium]
MTQHPRLIGVRHVNCGTTRVPVLLFRNDHGSVAGRLLLGDGDEPILDGATAEEVIKLIEAVIDRVLLARKRAA